MTVTWHIPSSTNTGSCDSFNTNKCKSILPNARIFSKLAVWTLWTSERGKCQGAKSGGDYAMHSTEGSGAGEAGFRHLIRLEERVGSAEMRGKHDSVKLLSHSLS